MSAQRRRCLRTSNPAKKSDRGAVEKVYTTACKHPQPSLRATKGSAAISFNGYVLRVRDCRVAPFRSLLAKTDFLSFVHFFNSSPLRTFAKRLHSVLVKDRTAREDNVNGERDMRMRSVFLLLVTLELVFASTQSFASDPGARPDLELKGAGYELTVEGLRQVFIRGKPVDVYAFARYITQYIKKKEDREKYVGLVPDIKNYLESRAERRSKEGLRMQCVRALFALENNMSRDDVEKYVRRVRENLFVKKKFKLGSFSALLAANTYKDIDIEEDLIHLSKTDILDRSPGKLVLKIPIGELFKRYHKTLTEAQILDIMAQWPGHPDLQNHILESAKRKGLLLEMQPVSESGHEQPVREPETVPALMEALKHEDVSVRWSAVHALRQVGTDAEGTVPALVEALKDEHEWVRKSAAFGLGEIGPAAKEAVPALIETLKHEDEMTREIAATALGKIGLAAEQAVPALIKTLRDEDREVRRSAMYALGKIGPAAKAAVPSLSETLKNEDLEMRRSAVHALGGIGPAAEDAVPAIIAVLKDEDSTLRESALSALRKIGHTAERAGLQERFDARTKVPGSPLTAEDLRSGFELARRYFAYGPLGFEKDLDKPVEIYNILKKHFDNNEFLMLTLQMDLTGLKVHSAKTEHKRDAIPAFLEACRAVLKLQDDEIVDSTRDLTTDKAKQRFAEDIRRFKAGARERIMSLAVVGGHLAPSTSRQLDLIENELPDSEREMKAWVKDQRREIERALLLWEKETEMEREEHGEEVF